MLLVGAMAMVYPTNGVEHRTSELGLTAPP